MTHEPEPGRLSLSALPLLLVTCAVACFTDVAFAGGTDFREIQNRAALVAKRKCADPPYILCNEDADCAPSTCADRNVFNLTVAVLFEADDDDDNGDLSTIMDSIKKGNKFLFDATDGQVEIGEVFIFNNAYSQPADIKIPLDRCSSGINASNVCNHHTDCPVSCVAGHCQGGEQDGESCDSDNPCANAYCGVWWSANTGGYGKDYAAIRVSIGKLGKTDDNLHWVHEFSHLVFDTLDEYETVKVGCEPYATVVGDSCPVPATLDGVPGQTNCIMSGLKNRDEYCWGQGNDSDPLDISGGNHDADLTTEQSRCRDGRSCWEQLVWSWPDVILMPDGAPDPEAHGAVTDDPEFLIMDATVRGVLVLDESGSMDDFDGSTTTRLARLKLAAKDFVTLAEDGTELGIVSFSTDAVAAPHPHASVPIAALGADRSLWVGAIDGLEHAGNTNIGDGLLKAMVLIENAPDAETAYPFIVLMTDGINNEPDPDPQWDLEEKLGMLAAAGIPVYVTCTGTDLGLESQCAEIADGTPGGWYVDSDESSDLAEAFVGFHERAARRDAVDSARGMLSTATEKIVFVEPGAESVAFTVVWENAAARANMIIIDPANNQYRGFPMPQGSYRRISAPISGGWRVSINRTPTTAADSRYVLRAYVRSQEVQMAAAVRHGSVLPGEPIYLYASLAALGRTLTHPTETIVGTVLRPDGTTDTVELHDQGRDASGQGDDLGGDATFTGVYANTNLPGAYTFLLRSEVDGWPQSRNSEQVATDFRSLHFKREVRLSAAVIPDCNGNGVDDVLDIRQGTSSDCNDNGTPDECDFAAGTSPDCNADGIPDQCDITSGRSADINANGIPDECEIGRAVWVLSGIAAGGQLSVTIHGFSDTCIVTVDTLAGQSAAMVAANLAAAINADGCLVAQDITARADGERVRVTGFLLRVDRTLDMTDQGLSYGIPIVAIPTLSPWALLLLGAALFTAAMIQLILSRTRSRRG